ncbi:ATP-binding protein [Desulfococcaceae bacterium HSG8]|nr:ATP-binding protein [Desulfococcaceae bacterium HSG8]
MRDETPGKYQIHSTGAMMRFLLIALLLLLPLAVVGGSMYYGEARTARVTLEIQAKESLRGQVGQIINEFEDIVSDLMYLAGQYELQKFLDQGTGDFRDALNREYLMFSGAKKIYDQIRFLDQNGMEIIRVNYNNGSPFAVPGEKLQNKGSRYYFRDTFELKQDQVFISPFDLNIERGQIEQPLKPMIRFGTPVYDSKGQRRGIVLLNYFGSALLEHLGQAALNAPGQVILLNREGYWIRGVLPEDEWGFMYKDRSERTFGKRYPGEWKTVAGSESGQFFTDNGLFSFITVYPLHKGQKSSTGAAGAAAPSQERIESQAYYWKVVSRIPTDILNRKPKQFLNKMIIPFAGLSLFMLMISGLLTLYKVRQAKAEQKIEMQNHLLSQKNQSLEHEIREREKTEQALVKARDAAQAANRAKSEFLANMSHEIRTPMNSVLGFLELTLNDSSVPESHRSNLSIAHNSAKSLLLLINDILDLSNLESGRLELEYRPFDLEQLMQDALLTIGIRAREKGLELSLDIYPDLPRYFTGDPDRLRQVLINLAGNAVKFTEKGRVWINAAPWEADDFLHFTVSDTGIGIPSDRLETIFDPFTQSDSSITRKFGGTGLGTTISKQLAELMGGRIWAESEIGKGSVFHFIARMKATEEKPEQDIRSLPEYDGSESHRRFRILLAEDIEENITLVRIRAERDGHAVIVARNGLEAVEMFERETRIDVILMDIQMPRMDGMEAARRIRKIEAATDRHIPIIALTASIMKEDQEAVLDAGMDDIVGKPIDFAKLFAIMNKLVREEHTLKPGHEQEAGPEKHSDDDSLPADESPRMTCDESFTEHFLKGIDTATGLEIWQDPDLYKKALVTFSRDYENSAAEILELVEKDDGDQAYQLIHKIKGVAANLSVTEVFHIAEKLGAGVREKPADELIPVIRSLSDALNTAVHSIRQIEPENAARKSEGQSLEDTQLTCLFREMLEAFGEYNPNAVEPFLEKLELSLPADQTGPIRQHLERFDFKGAIAETMKLAETLGIEV